MDGEQVDASMMTITAPRTRPAAATLEGRMASYLEGTVTDAAHHAVAGHRVAVVTWQPGSATVRPLAESVTDGHGAYRLAFEPPATDGWVLVCVMDAAGQVLAWSDTISSAAGTSRVDLVLGGAPETPPPATPTPPPSAEPPTTLVTAASTGA